MLREDLEKQRIRLHLIRVEMKLRRANTNSLSSHQKAKREIHINRLHNYWVAGEFPKNINYPGKLLPHFKDHRGVLCAVGYLMHQDGESELVNEIAKTNNLVRINDIKSGPVLDWLENNGITQQEAAEIQPAYYDPRPVSPLSDIIPTALLLSAVLFLVLEVISSKFLATMKIKASEAGRLRWYFRGLSAGTALGISFLILAFINA